MDQGQGQFEEWAIVELMGHRKLGGLVSEAEIGGIPFLRVDIFAGEKKATQFYGKQAIYCLTPTSEEIARGLGHHFHAPVSRWELPEAPDASAEVVETAEEIELEPYDDEGQ